MGERGKDRSRSRSRDRHRHRGRRSSSRSESRSRSPSRSRDRGRAQDRGRDKYRRSKSRSRSASRSRSRSRSREERPRPRSNFSEGPSAIAQIQAQALAQLQQQQLQQQLLAQTLLLQKQAAGGLNPANKKQRELYIGNLAIGTVHESMLRELFNGALAALVPDPITNPPVVKVDMDASGRFGFVELRSEDLATAALQLDKVELCGRNINVGRPKGYVEPMHPRTPSLPMPGMGGMMSGMGGMPGMGGGMAGMAGMGGGMGGMPGMPGMGHLATAAKLSVAHQFAASLGAGAAAAAAPPPVAGVGMSNVVLLENLANVTQLLDEKERKELVADVHAECAKCGTVLGLAVPLTSTPQPCRVYVRFGSAAEAAKCRDTMDGRSFDNNKIKATFVTEEDFSRANKGEWILPPPQAPPGAPPGMGRMGMPGAMGMPGPMGPMMGAMGGMYPGTGGMQMRPGMQMMPGMMGMGRGMMPGM